MMKALSLLFVMMTGFVSAQDKFSFTKDGLTDYVVTEVTGKTKSEMYKKTLDWISVTYKDPKDGVRGQAENDFIKFEGSGKDIVCLDALGKKKCNNAKYQVLVSFKDGKYKFDVISISIYNEASSTNAAGWTAMKLDANDYYGKLGEIKNAYKHYPEMIPAFFDNLNASLKEFILNGVVPAKKSDW